jgi:methionine-R-sulfoxide reductase
VLREEGTERAGTSPLDREKRAGVFVCAGCGLAVFTSEMKFDSGTGWPSFFTYIPGAFQTKTDYKIIYPRTEYHCAKCGGHHGHVFDDGPQPTGKRYCNNGVSLKFIPKKDGKPKLLFEGLGRSGSAPGHPAAPVRTLQRCRILGGEQRIRRALAIQLAVARSRRCSPPDLSDSETS